MKITGPNGEVDLSDTVPYKFLGGPVSIAIQNLGVCDPSILVFPGLSDNVSKSARTFFALESEVTGYVRLTGFPSGVFPDLTQLRRVDGKALTSQDFEQVAASLDQEGLIAFAEKVIRVTLDEDDNWLVRP